ncbi:MAG: GatB/YqeY domain-containing protein [Methylobacteriaceae bacterium]|nr:GatB/YqeY domain-containing protein [Methylobacteriaceae bacterium]
MREELSSAVKAAMKSGDRLRVDTLRMVQSALKNREIEARGAGKSLSAEDELSVLQKLVKSRQESVELYEKGGRQDLASKERAEIAIISEFLPQQMGDDDMKAAIVAAIGATGAAGMKDMGKVIGALRAQYAGRMDFGKASALVKAALSGR